MANSSMIDDNNVKYLPLDIKDYILKEKDKGKRIIFQCPLINLNFNIKKIMTILELDHIQFMERIGLKGSIEPYLFDTHMITMGMMEAIRITYGLSYEKLLYDEINYIDLQEEVMSYNGE